MDHALSDPGDKGRGRNGTAANAAGAAFGRSREGSGAVPEFRPVRPTNYSNNNQLRASRQGSVGSDDERAETTGLNSGEVLATLMDLEMERHHWQLPDASLLRSEG